MGISVLPEVPRTWNEAAHILRRDEQPEDYGHTNCPWCEAAKEAHRDERRTRTGDGGIQ